MKLLTEKVALVTASTRGIGLACVKKLCENGAKVYLTAMSTDEGKEVVAELASQGMKTDFVYFDATVEKSFTSMIDDVIDKEGKIDILVNNFGTTDVTKDKDLLNGDTDAFFNILNINIKSVYLPIKHSIKYMIEQKSGSIINISSIGGKIPDISRLAYGTSKSAINYMTKTIAIQYAKYGIRCNGVMPGLIGTDAAMHNMPKEFLDLFIKNTPIGRIGKPEDIANAVLFLASDNSSYMTGELLEIAGGFGKPTPLYGFM